MDQLRLAAAWVVGCGADDEPPLRAARPGQLGAQLQQALIAAPSVAPLQGLDQLASEPEVL